MLKAMELTGNASSVHGEGRAAHQLLDESRETIAREIGVIAPMVIFTSGGSEANNLAIKGAEAMVVRDRLALRPQIHGGGQELRRRAGTENLPAIAGFAAAAAEKRMEIKALRDRLEVELEDVTIFGLGTERLHNTTCFGAA